MNAMHRRSAWVSAAVLLGLAGTASATDQVRRQGEPAANQATQATQMRSIPVERLRPLRVDARRESIAVERVRPMRAADLLAVSAVGTIEPETSAGSTLPEEPAPSRNNPIPFDRSALVPTGSRWVEGKKPTIKPAPTSRFAGLVPTPMPGTTPSATPGTTPGTAANSWPASAPSVATTTPTTTTTTASIVPVDSAPVASVPVASVPMDSSPVEAATASDQPTETIAQAAPVEPMAAPVGTEPAARPIPHASTAASTIQTGTGFHTIHAGTPEGTTQTTTSETTTASATNIPASHTQTDTARLAAMFPAPEGWGTPRRLSANGTTPHGWDLVATPLPSAPAEEANPITTRQSTPATDTTEVSMLSEPAVLEPAFLERMQSEPLQMHESSVEVESPAMERGTTLEPVSSATMRDMMPQVDEVSGFVAHHSAMNAAHPPLTSTPLEGAPSAQEQGQIAEPASGMSVRMAPAERTSRGMIDSQDSIRTQAILDGLARKSISREVYEDSLRRLSARRDGMTPTNQPLMAGDALGVSIARSAGYVD